MKFELKEYQEEAVSKVLVGLRKGSAEFVTDGGHTAVSMSAPTGAGKTVIAAAVIERLLFGDTEGSVDEDPDAVFLWLTDDPSLNEQTRKKILEASDRIQPGHLVTLDDGFDQPEFGRGKVYFLNIQKLAKTSNLVARKEGRRRNILWDTITTTIKKNGAHYYFIVDEAHRGTGKTSTDDNTIVQRLLNGNDSVVSAPVVLGISATPERFESSIMSGSRERLLRNVVVPVSAVRESGLIKDVLSISYQAEKQTMEFTLLREGVISLREVDSAWNSYTERENESPVRPALVIQIPPNANSTEVGSWLDVCVEEWKVLGKKYSIAHSLESHTPQQFGSHVVHYVKPQDIHDHPSVRVVLFKEALTTGWDCPRAEVMVSLRTAKDDTYIAQLIGRMVRSPLARRIESDERLNRVRLFLPNFDKAAVEKVKGKLEGNEGGLPTDIELNSVDAPRNRKIAENAFSAVESLPSYQVPGPVHRSQVARLHKLAALLSGDHILPNAIKVADGFLISVLESERERIVADGALAGLLKDAETAEVEVMDVNADGTSSMSTEIFSTDPADVDRHFSTTRRRFRDGLADKYWGSRVENNQADPFDAKILTIALSMNQAVVDQVEKSSADRVKQWLDTHGDAVASLSEDKKAKYAEVRAMAREPEIVHPGLPITPITMSGDESIDTYKGHLYANAEGNFRSDLKSWEQHVLKVESERADFTAWYRNPPGGQRALRIPFETTNGYGKMYPDFIILQSSDGDSVSASVVDPHGQFLADASDKLRGLAEYAAKHGDSFTRIVSVIKNERGEFRMLDLKDPTIRKSLKNLRSQDDIENIYSEFGSVYA